MRPDRYEADGRCPNCDRDQCAKRWRFYRARLENYDAGAEMENEGAPALDEPLPPRCPQPAA
jgi:hypothetical protein